MGRKFEKAAVWFFTYNFLIKVSAIPQSYNLIISLIIILFIQMIG